jgi:hypothetical protein
MFCSVFKVLIMVETPGLEPGTPTLQTWCSPAELRPHIVKT